MNRRDVRALVGTSEDWMPIVVQTEGLATFEAGVIAMHLLELARANHWRLINLNDLGRRLPPDVPMGALVTDASTEPAIQQLVRLGVPTVRIALNPPIADPQLPTVMHDLEGYGQMAAEHFAQRDFKHVAFLAHDPWAEYKPVYDGLKERAAQLNIQCHLGQISLDRLRCNATDEPELWQMWQQRFSEWILSLPRPVGLLVESDASADRDCQWLAEAGLGVPEDVAVLGIGNQTFVCESAPVPLSSMAYDPNQFAHTAAGMLQKLMAGKPLDQTIVKIPPLQAVTRKSTDVLAASAPNVIRALRFMWDHVSEDLSVDQIAEHVGVSRRVLERAFRQELQRGINQEFQRRRLEKVRELLIQTDLSIAEIAGALSFSSQNYLCRTFRTAYGQTPTAFRRAHAPVA